MSALTDLLREAVLSSDVGADKLGILAEMIEADTQRADSHARTDADAKARVAFDKAFVKASAKIAPIARDAVNSRTGSAFLKLETLDAAVSPVMAEFGFGLSFKAGDSPYTEDHMHVIAVLKHKGGHREVYEDRRVPIAHLEGDGDRIHCFGATKTYARRYVKMDIWDVVPTTGLDGDTDGVATVAAAARGRADADAGRMSRNAESRAIYSDLQQEIDACGTDLDELNRLSADPEFLRRKELIPVGWEESINERLKASIRDAAAARMVA